jgi:hypothetical protein
MYDLVFLQAAKSKKTKKFGAEISAPFLFFRFLSAGAKPALKHSLLVGSGVSFPPLFFLSL